MKFSLAYRVIQSIQCMHAAQSRCHLGSIMGRLQNSYTWQECVDHEEHRIPSSKLPTSWHASMCKDTTHAVSLILSTMCLTYCNNAGGEVSDDIVLEVARGDEDLLHLLVKCNLV